MPLRNNDITIEQRLIQSANKHGKKSVIVLDSWGDYRSRFCSKEGRLLDEYRPTIICALDVESSERLVGTGFTKDQIRITGNPHFDKVVSNVRLNKLDCSGDIDRKAINLLYVSQPIREKDNRKDYGIDQEENFLRLKEVIRNSNLERPVNIIVWKHPKEYMIDWKMLVKSDDQNMRCILSTDRGPGVLSWVDGLFTYYSTMIYEALYYDIPSYNLLIGSKIDLGSILITHQLGLSSLIRDDNELLDALTEIQSASAKHDMKKRRLKYQEEQVFFSDGNATARVINVVNEILTEEYT